MQASKYSEIDRDNPVVDQEFAAFLSAANSPEPKKGDEMKETESNDDAAQQASLLLTASPPPLIPPQLGAGYELQSDIDTEMMPEMQLQEVSNNTPILSGYGASQPESLTAQSLPPADEKLATELNMGEDNSINQPTDSPIFLGALMAHEPNMTPGKLASDLQQTEVKAGHEKNAKVQTPTAALELSQLIAEAKAVTSTSGIVNELKQLKEQLAEQDLPKQPLTIEQPSASSFKTLLTQTGDSSGAAPTTVEVIKDTKSMTPYEIHYEAGMATQAAAQKASLRIHQEGLGQINVKIEMNHQQSSVTLVAESNEAKQVMQAHLPQLKQFFSDANLHLAHANIEQRASQDQSPQQKDQQQPTPFSGGATAELIEVSENATRRRSQSLIDAYV